METQPHATITITLCLSEVAKLTTPQIWEQCRDRGLDPRTMWPEVDVAADEIRYTGNALTGEGR